MKNKAIIVSHEKEKKTEKERNIIKKYNVVNQIIFFNLRF